MFGKIFGSMFEGSMVGSGACVFAVMSYIIAKMVPDREHGMVVEINPKLLAFTLGETQKNVESAIDFLCKPDKHSRTKDEQGRRLIRLGEFDYRVVNGLKYRQIRNEEARMEQNRTAQARKRFKQLNPGRPLPGELAYLQAARNGASDEELDQLSEPRKLTRAEKGGSSEK